MNPTTAAIAASPLILRLLYVVLARGKHDGRRRVARAMGRGKRVKEQPFSVFLADARANRLEVLMSSDVSRSGAAAARRAAAAAAGRWRRRRVAPPLLAGGHVRPLQAAKGGGGRQAGALGVTLEAAERAGCAVHLPACGLFVHRMHHNPDSWPGPRRAARAGGAAQAVGPVIVACSAPGEGRQRCRREPERGSGCGGSGGQDGRRRRRRRSPSFADVAGVDGPKQELAELVEFLRDSSRFDSMGARMPRGVLLSGPAGTGKTMLARALATEAAVPFFFASASEFVETLVGRGAARVRDLWQRARQAAPSIIFIDEIDSLGRSRGGLNSTKSGSRAQPTLTEMDGRTAPCGTAASTTRRFFLRPCPRPRPRPAAAAAAARRAGDRRDEPPGRPGRGAAPARPLRPPRRRGPARPKRPRRDPRRARPPRAHRRPRGGEPRGVARVTAGLGADLANVVNEAALLAVRAGLEATTGAHFDAAVAKQLRYKPGSGNAAALFSAPLRVDLD